MDFFIHKSTNDQYYFNVVADNGKTLAHSETYVQKESAKHAAQLIIDEASGGAIYDVDE